MLKKVDWDTFEFRCHYLGELLTPVRGKSYAQQYEETCIAYKTKMKQLETMNPETKAMDKAVESLYKLKDKRDELAKVKDTILLSETAKKRLAQIYTEETTGRKKDIESLAIEKGLMTEEESITKYSLRTGLFYRKNRERVGNGFIVGEIDFDDDEKDMVIDTKSSFDIFTFDATVAKKMGNIYFWQGQGYMWLKNRQNFRLAYCLNNTPDELIRRMIKSLEYKFIGSAEDLIEAIEELKLNNTYDDLPLERKVRIYDLKRDDEKIELLKSQIPHFREYLKNIENSKFEEDEY